MKKIAGTSNNRSVNFLNNLYFMQLSMIPGSERLTIHGFADMTIGASEFMKYKHIYNFISFALHNI